LTMKWSEDAMDVASWKGHIDALNWWENSQPKLKRSENVLEEASGSGHVKILDWW
ncbi:hypothetical protein BJ742DRAFT_668512, partial [Cladochytrium replicatum]